MKTKNKIPFGTALCCLFIVLFAMPAKAQFSVRFHNEDSDTTRITKLLVEAGQHDFKNAEERTAFLAKKFIGTPYVAHTLECDSAEVLTVNLDELDCTTFVETVAALSYTAGEGRYSWQDFLYNLRRIRYRGGVVDGYASRLHYICDWAVDNIMRGNIIDASPLFPKCNYIVRTIDFMSANRKLYPALADQANYDRLKSIESGYHNHRFPYLKLIDIKSKATYKNFRNGDIVAFVSNLKNLDVTHMGIIVKDDTPDAKPYVLHASSSNKKVEISQEPLSDFVKKNRHWLGVRVFRLGE